MTHAKKCNCLLLLNKQKCPHLAKTSGVMQKYGNVGLSLITLLLPNFLDLKSRYERSCKSFCRQSINFPKEGSHRSFIWIKLLIFKGTLVMVVVEKILRSGVTTTILFSRGEARRSVGGQILLLASSVPILGICSHHIFKSMTYL